LQRPIVVPLTSDVRVFQAVPKPFRRGPFQTKSGGKLFVDFVLPGPDVISRFGSWQKSELDQIPREMRGLRGYRVVDLPVGSVGGTEFHRIREEIVIGLAGALEWTCEDFEGGQIIIQLIPGVAVWMPPFILHTYKALEEGSGIQVLCNTLLYPDDPATSDTYSREAFLNLTKQS